MKDVEGMKDSEKVGGSFGFRSCWQPDNFWSQVLETVRWKDRR